jgi:hypothetical protein
MNHGNDDAPRRLIVLLKELGETNPTRKGRWKGYEKREGARGQSVTMSLGSDAQIQDLG